MGTNFRSICSIALCSTLLGCGSVPVQFESAAARPLSIAIVPMNEPAEVIAHNSLGTGIVALGLIGGMIQSALNATHTTIYTDLVKKNHQEFSSSVPNLLAEKLAKSGYRMISIADVQPAAVGKTLDLSKIKTDADAILNVVIESNGYISPLGSADYEPYIEVQVRLFSTKSKRSLYSKKIIAGWQSRALKENVACGDKYRYATFDELAAKPEESIRGLDECWEAVAAYIANDLSFPPATVALVSP
jgi:hypothetical protein